MPHEFVRQREHLRIFNPEQTNPLPPFPLVCNEGLMKLHKEMKRLFTTIILFAVAVSTFGQQTFGIKINAGLSYLKTERVSYSSLPDTQKFYPVLSGQGGLTYSYNFNTKFLIGTEILYTQIEGKEVITGLSGMSTDNTITIDGHYEIDTYRHIYYLGLPIYVGYNFNNLNINIGIQGNFKLGGSSHWNANSVYNNGVTDSYESESEKLDINKFDYGLRFGVFYKLSPKYSIETNYYHGLSDIANGGLISGSPVWSVQQLTIGIKYNLLELNKKKK